MNTTKRILIEESIAIIFSWATMAFYGIPLGKYSVTAKRLKNGIPYALKIKIVLKSPYRPSAPPFTPTTNWRGKRYCVAFATRPVLQSF